MVRPSLVIAGEASWAIVFMSTLFISNFVLSLELTLNETESPFLVIGVE